MACARTPGSARGREFQAGHPCAWEEDVLRHRAPPYVSVVDTRLNIQRLSTSDHALFTSVSHRTDHLVYMGEHRQNHNWEFQQIRPVLLFGPHAPLLKLPDA